MQAFMQATRNTPAPPNQSIPSATHGEDRKQSSGHAAILVPGSHTNAIIALSTSHTEATAGVAKLSLRRGQAFANFPTFLVALCCMRTGSSESHNLDTNFFVLHLSSIQPSSPTWSLLGQVACACFAGTLTVVRWLLSPPPPPFCKQARYVIWYSVLYLPQPPSQQHLIDFSATMGIFNKRNTTPVAADTTTATGAHEKRSRPRRASRGAASSYNTRPSFGQWIKATWLDIVTMAAMGALSHHLRKWRDRLPEFAYPLRNEIIPIWAAALMAFFIPFAVFLIVQIRARSFWDINNATIGLLYSLIAAAVFQVFIKWLIGGLRPHFLAVCKPVIPQSMLASVGANNNGNEAGGPFGNVANGYRQIMFDRSICTGDKNEINDSLESMPSGHTTAAFAGFVFLYLYLNAKLKVFSNYHPAMWKLIALYAPILGACLIGGALTIDEYHNWYDILVGALIGTMMAFSAYRMVYASVWDFRFNHIPLMRHAPMVFGAGPSSSDGFHDVVFTRKAGWGTHEGGSWGGAPFDAADGPRGTMMPHPEGPAAGGVHRKPVGASRHGEQMV
ncbi:hypothetical protein P3342_012733 [Pyrenophora teres f. teres]|nr:hypothetical protein P3342_012733 [Pyrenophora teres f. teres]